MDYRCDSVGRVRLDNSSTSSLSCDPQGTVGQSYSKVVGASSFLLFFFHSPLACLIQRIVITRFYTFFMTFILLTSRRNELYN